MRPARKIRLIVHFYRGFWLLSSLITAACMVLFWEYGFGIFSMLLWFKLATMFLIFRFIKSYKAREFYYYHNLGVSKLVLWGVTLSFDLIVYLFLLFQVNRFR